MQKLLVVHWFEQWRLKPCMHRPCVQFLTNADISRSFSLLHKMFVTAKIIFVGVLVQCKE